MRSILCFGDSNTYGDSPEGFGRYERHERWTGILQELLGEEYLVIEEGLNGRTTVWEDEVECDKSGKKQLPSCLRTHAPLDMVILMLGTNDLKRRFNVTPSDIAFSIEVLVKIVLTQENGRRRDPPRLLLTAPPMIREETFLGEIFGNRKADSLRLGELYRRVAEHHGCEFLNAAELVEPSPLDGLHLDRASHKVLAAAMAHKVQEIFA